MLINPPLVSVIIPAYNHEKYIQETIKSIINQTYKNIELIIVDDGSKDNTWQKIQEMKEECEKRFKRVVFQTKENEGTCKTLNLLIDLAKGKFIYIIASDDIAKPQAIKKEVSFLSRNKNYALVVGNNEFIDAEGKKCFWDKDKNNVYIEKEACYKTFADKLEEIMKFKLTSSKFGTYSALRYANHVPNGYLIRKSIFKKFMPFTPEAPLEDYYMMLQISKYAKMKYLDEILFSYRWHDCNTIKNNEKAVQNDMKTREYEKLLIQDIENLKKNKCNQEVLDFSLYGELKLVRERYGFLQSLYFVKGNKRTKVKRFFNKTVYIKIIDL